MGRLKVQGFQKVVPAVLAGGAADVSAQEPVEAVGEHIIERRGEPPIGKSHRAAWRVAAPDDGVGVNALVHCFGQFGYGCCSCHRTDPYAN